MAWALLVLGTFCVVECFIRLPLLKSARRLTDLLGKITAVLRSSSISDHWKEKILPVYAGRLFTGSVAVFAWVVLGLMPMVALVFIAESVDVPLLPLVSSLSGLAASTAVAVVYALLRNRVVSG